MTRGYGQFCPVAKAAELFCERWNALLFRELGAGATRFSELQRGVPLMSPSMLSRRLRELEREGVIECRVAGGARRYHLTPSGEEFLPLVRLLGIWGRRWTRRQLRADEVDYRLLLWDMERNVNPRALGAGQVVVQLTFSDLPEGRAHWWFLNQSTVQLCVKDPGFEVDLFLSTRVADLIHVWRGDISLARSLDNGHIKAHGPTSLVKKLGRWLNPGEFAAVPAARDTR